MMDLAHEAELATKRQHRGPLGGIAKRIGKSLLRSRDQNAAMLIVSSRHRLWQRYGPDGVAAIERAVADLTGAMAARDLTGALAYVDDSPLLSQYGVLPADATQPKSVAHAVRDLAARMAWTDDSVRYVLILGDDGIVPFHRPENPSPEDGDEVVSDQIYAADPKAPLHAVRAVGRMPDPSLEALLGSLRSAAAAHRRLADGDDLPLQPRGFGYSASVWKRAARGVFETLEQPQTLRLSPPLSHREIPEPGSAGPRFRYFNLHGLVDSPHWFGQRDPSFPADYPLFPVALRPVDLDPAPGAVVFSEACYGAHIQGRGVRDSVALTYLSGGALAFAGATGVAYGGLDGPLVAADLLAQRFWQAILSGAPAGQALAFAKRSLVEEAMARQGYLDAEDEKAILNFVLFGDPSLVHHVPIVWDEDSALAAPVAESVERVGLAERVGTLSVRPHSKFVGDACGPTANSAEAERVGAAGSSDELVLIDEVRRVVAKRLPEFAADDVQVTSAPAGGGLVAKSLHATRAAPLIVTLTKSARTCGGAPCAETVRVTVDRSGTIRKVVVAR